MAIEQSTINFQSFEDMEMMRNAPTPPVQGSSLKPDPDFDLNFGYSLNYTNSIIDDEHYGLLHNNQTIVFQQPGATTSSNQMYPSDPFFASSTPMMQSANYQFIASPFSPKFHDSISTTHLYGEEPVSGRESVMSKMSSSRKEKCMTRNAIAARENREKKKSEVVGLRGKVKNLEQENALYKKKYYELKEGYKQMEEQQKYYDSVLNNLPSLMNIIEHMKSLPNKEERAKKLKKKLSNINFTNNNLGICFHVKTNQEMSLRFCETCSNGFNGSSSKKKNAET